ncbi:hypothetical protein DTL21_12245 [Bremerella cremea]|uniref:Uncharacterized protein n=1 Tax=Blastopirellula marina TaxID=124 RepID=A0A2S8FQ37_9BACT|nr:MULTISPECIES: hypothetical protein [Pirellulaceae]PQO34296.1 hypothetical protein C5Y83_12240 [Blastopirellula marina]RCS46792.1 hypothetical protein DTL21_12245 [Bremerella cremea]
MTTEIARAESMWMQIKSQLHLLSPENLTDDEQKMATQVEADLKRVLKGSGWRYSSNNYIVRGQSCVQAANDRGAYVAPHLPCKFTIISVTHKSKLHTYNATFFRSSKGRSHYWLFDTYVMGTTSVYYAGPFLPSVLYHNTENKTYYGGRPGKWW